MRIFLTFFISFLSATLSAASINYTVSMPEPHTHYFQVEMEISDYDKEYVDVKMPVWAPGSYLVREFAKSVQEFEASSNDKKLVAKKINKNTWRVNSNNAKNITVKYMVYAFEMSVRTSFVDASHGYFNGTSMFMYIDDLKNQEHTLTVVPFKNWKKVTTALKRTSQTEFKYTAPNYDILVDAPVEIGNQVTFEFDAAGIKHHVAMYGAGNYEIEKLKTDMAKICEAATDVFGENPNNEYTFIIHNLTRGSGGLEHLNSTTLQVNRYTYGEENYKGFLSLVAHEYFHLWNVKRIRPDVLGPFDYDNENYTDLLWVMEGFTSYYDELLLYRAGFYSEEEILGKFKGSINSIENQPGNKVQPVADASFNAWIKAYRPNENSYNTTISYYTKGSVVANMLDILIIDATKGKKSLDDVMKHLYNEFYKKQGRGFTSEEMKQTLETISGKDLTGFYAKYINGTETFMYNDMFQKVNYEVEGIKNSKPFLGVNASGNVIKRVIKNSSAYDGGLNVNDEIIAIDGYRLTTDIRDAISAYKNGDELDFEISRDNIIQHIKVTLKERGSTYYNISKQEKDANNNQKVWLRQL